jgi:hypothetical protein
VSAAPAGHWSRTDGLSVLHEGSRGACTDCVARKAQKPTIGAVAAYDALIADLREKARKAAAHNKVTMWAYYIEMAEQLWAWFEPSERTDEEYEEAALALMGHGHAVAPELAPSAAACAWSMALYATRILQASGHRCYRPSLEWLRKRAGAERPQP